MLFLKMVNNNGYKQIGKEMNYNFMLNLMII